MDRAAKYKEGYFDRPILEKDFFDLGLMRPDQHATAAYTFGYFPYCHRLRRKPQKVLSIGCGQGMLEAFLGERVPFMLGTDIADNRDERFKDKFDFKECTMDRIDYVDFDTVILCEAIEHIPQEEFDRNWPKIVAMLKRTKGLFIVTNWVHFHPILPDSSGWDHVREINNELYDHLESFGIRVVRDGSHLVINFQ